MTAVDAWRAADPLARTAWITSTPQHFHDGSKGVGPLNGSQVNCSAEPNVWMHGAARRAEPNALGMLPPAARALCGSPLREPAALRDCARPAALHDWRNRMSAPLLAAHSMPVVPLTAALGVRGELHPGGSDCTHWCHASEASLHMAGAALNLLKGL